MGDQEDDERRRRERIHIVEAFELVFERRAEFLDLVAGAADRAEARRQLVSGPFALTDIQANHVLDMPFGRMTELARSELRSELKQLRMDG